MYTNPKLYTLHHAYYLYEPPPPPPPSQYMYKALFEWCGHTNRENKQVAFLALEAFLQQVGRAMCAGQQCMYM